MHQEVVEGISRARTHTHTYARSTKHEAGGTVLPDVAGFLISSIQSRIFVSIPPPTHLTQYTPNSPRGYSIVSFVSFLCHIGQ